MNDHARSNPEQSTSGRSYSEPLFKTLRADKIISTLEVLEQRIFERFPGSGLVRVCSELLSVARGSEAEVTALIRPNFFMRGAIATVLILGLALLGYVGTIIEFKRNTENLFGVLEGIDAALSILIAMGAGIFFLATAEARWKRQRALDDLHELRSLIHVIDMHQLTKDPAKESLVSTQTKSSPQRIMTPFELSRYLDYCAEMLSLAAKIAALYAQGTRDEVVIETASDLSQITTHMSGKIWQKITLVQSIVGAGMAHAPLPPEAHQEKPQDPSGASSSNKASNDDVSESN
ncbi:MAG: hypothetical protein ACRBCJ_11425 [Hyphomicrobiaceae bacterium]